MAYQASGPEPENRFQGVLAAFADAQREREAVRLPRSSYRQAPREAQHFQKPQGRPQPVRHVSSLDEAFGRYFRQS